MPASSGASPKSFSDKFLTADVAQRRITADGEPIRLTPHRVSPAGFPDGECRAYPHSPVATGEGMGLGVYR
ncbi:hypothetical protein ACFLTL_02090 [Chloroflexota bacterium]